MLTQLAKRQQIFSMTMFGIIVLALGIVAGLFLFPRLTADYAQPAQREARTRPERNAAPVPPASAPESQPQAGASTQSPPAQSGIAGESIAAEETTPRETAASYIQQPSASEVSQSPIPIQPDRSQPSTARSTDPGSQAAAPSSTGQLPATNTPAEGEGEESEPAAGSETSAANASRTSSSENLDAAARLALENERQYAYFKGQGDLLLRQGLAEEALTRYDSALTYEPSDADLRARINQLRDSIQAAAAASEAERRLAERRARVTDEQGIFVVPDTPPVIMEEERIRSMVVYPSRAERAGIEGRVTVRMVINEDGSVSNQTIVQSLGFGCDAEVLRVLDLARFRPATFNGEAVPAWYMFTVLFSQN